MKSRVIQLRDESQSKVVKRMLAAQKANSEVQRATNLGRHFNVDKPENLNKLTKEQALVKIRESTKRLSQSRDVAKASPSSNQAGASKEKQVESVSQLTKAKN